ncbi:MAG: LLM class F420-dependent oxidoreductase [Gammaproteobacteria bacterium]
MKIGINLGRLNPGLWTAATERADALGFESAWLPEHLVLPAAMSGSPNAGESHPPVPANIPVFDTFVYFAMLAGRTARIRFGTFVYNIGLRHPFVTARAVATLDVLSGGRFEFGIGASWLREEWQAAGLDFDSRGRRVDEALQVCRRLWTEPVVEHHGEFFDFQPVMFEPKPVQPGGPPIHVGGDARPALRRAALHGDGWVPLNTPLEGLRAALDRIHDLRDRAGRSGRVEVTIALPVQSRSDLARYAEAGVDRVLISPWKRSSEALDAIAHAADSLLA